VLQRVLPLIRNVGAANLDVNSEVQFTKHGTQKHSVIISIQIQINKVLKLMTKKVVVLPTGIYSGYRAMLWVHAPVLTVQKGR